MIANSPDHNTKIPFHQHQQLLLLFLTPRHFLLKFLCVQFVQLKNASLSGLRLGAKRTSCQENSAKTRRPAESNKDQLPRSLSTIISRVFFLFQ